MFWRVGCVFDMFYRTGGALVRHMYNSTRIQKHDIYMIVGINDDAAYEDCFAAVFLLIGYMAVVLWKSLHAGLSITSECAT